MAAAAVQQWEDRFRDLARANGWSFEIEVHPDGGIPRTVRHFPDFKQVLSLHVGGPNGNAVIGGLLIPALDQARQDLFGGYYDPRTDQPMLYQCEWGRSPQRNIDFGSLFRQGPHSALPQPVRTWLSLLHPS